MGKHETPRKQTRASGNARGLSSRSFYSLLRESSQRLDNKEVIAQFQLVDKARVEHLASLVSRYLAANLPAALDKRTNLADYRTNPYVLMTSARIMDLADPQEFAAFLFNTKLYMGLETSFGKSIEAAFVSQYPLNTDTVQRWIEPPEKLAEFKTLQGLTREEKAAQRIESVWREIDKSCVVGDRRFMTSIKSGPNCINDTQVAGMTEAFSKQHRKWLAQTQETYPNVRELDLIIGITYGTDKTTNNKENQILAKLLTKGFVEENRKNKPGVLIDKATRKVRIYRRIGRAFWASIGNPIQPANTHFVFLEVLLSLASALASVMTEADLEMRINTRIEALIGGLRMLMFPRNSLPEWIRKDFSDTELFWFATALTAFYDEGI